DRERAVDDLDADRVAGHAGQLGPDVRVFLVLVEVDGELPAAGHTGKAGQRRSEQPVELISEALSGDAVAEPGNRGGAAPVGWSVSYESHSDSRHAWAMPGAGKAHQPTLQ